MSFDDYIVKDITLADWGHKEIDIAETEMPGLVSISEEYRFMEAIPYEANYEQNPSPLSLHTKNFLDAIKNNSPESLNCGIESGSVACINAHMGNVSYLTGDKVYWDKDKKLFINNDKANKLINPTYNNGWKLPKL